ncbi:hypothetical protein WJX73_006004 [Symbiochloris irregularis]|uniref:Bestrophin n=1 Tax=Symbiochloris irregularis TaxID=706552 RepID=A0AAW1NPQ4_9CHLO
MITYNKIAWGLPLLCRLYGSALPRSVPPALLSAGVTAAFFVCIGDDDKGWWRHPYPFQLFGYMVGFIVIFRSNFGYQRYWEGRSFLQGMTSAWVDACVQVVVFDQYPVTIEGKEEAASKGGLEAKDRFRRNCFHLFSLLHALCIQHLRTDWDLHNLRPHLPSDPAPMLDAAGLPSQEGMLLHNLHYLDVFLLRGSDGRRQIYNRRMPLPVIGGLAAEEAAVLGEEHQAEGYLETSTLFGGIDRRGSHASRMWHHLGLTTGMYVPGAAERAAACYTWVHQLLQERLAAGGLGTPAPVLANVYRSLTLGYRSFQSCRTLVDTPFPFPWAQLVLMLLLIFSITCPLLIVGFVNTLWLAIILDFIIVQTYWALNEVARDLEDPYVYEPNDLPMARLQYAFNKRLMAISNAQRPDCLLAGGEDQPPAMESPRNNVSVDAAREPGV